ncbi:hypothetical protein [Liberibacter crescens]|uniref:hypothetical protein n=1 Tax=Liberibacter crescens TaxID=1273132 RepID=UPI001181B457|nr:hypothetical protein [Liberibacter crescens]
MIETYCSAYRISETTLSTYIFNDGKRINSIRRGSDVGTRRLESAFRWLYDRWPENTPWPDNISHPDIFGPAPDNEDTSEQ